MTKRLKIAAAVLVPLMALGVGFYVFKAPKKEIVYNKFIHDSYFMNDLKIGQVVRFKDLVKISEGYVCTFRAYQGGEISFAHDVAHEARINAYLDDNSIDPPESKVIFIISDRDAKNITISEIEDVFYGLTEDEESLKKAIPANFTRGWSGGCESLNTAAVTKVIARKSLKISGQIKVIDENHEFILIGAMK